MSAPSASFQSSVPSHYFARTPQHTKQSFQNAPFTNQTILVTPGMFGNQCIPTETPSHFIDTKSYLLDSPVPPELMSVKKAKPTTHDLRVTRRQDIRSPELEPPTVTLWRKDIPLPVPPPQLQVPPTYAEITPPMPPCLAPQTNHLPMPSEPVQISQHVVAKVMPLEPVRLAEEFGCQKDSPVEPIQLAEKFGQGVMLEEQEFLAGTGDGQGTQSSWSVTGHPSEPITPKGHPRLDGLVLEDEMPQTPEMTVTSRRFMDIKSLLSGKQANQLASPNLPPNVKLDDAPQQPSVSEKLDHPVAPVTEVEFSQVVAYLRLFPIDVINQKVADINTMLANKQDASFIGEAEIQKLELGPKTKAFLLLLARLGRLNKRKRPDSEEQVYYVIN